MYSNKAVFHNSHTLKNKIDLVHPFPCLTGTAGSELQRETIIVDLAAILILHCNDSKITEHRYSNEQRDCVFVCVEPGKNAFQEHSSRSMNSSWSPCVSWGPSLHCSRWYKTSLSAAYLNIEDKIQSFSISLSLMFMKRLVYLIQRDRTHLSHSRSNKIWCCSERTIAFAIPCWRNCDLKKEKD